MNYNQFCEALLKTRVGREFRYHSGLLMETRQKCSDVNKIGRVAYALYLLDLARLFQRRIDEYRCDYILVPIRQLRQRDIDDAAALTPII